MEELWRDIKGFEGHYMVSNFGRVKSLPRSGRDSYGRLVRYKGKILKPSKNSNGYYRVELKREDTKSRFFVHRLVATHFVENPDPVRFAVVNHLDFNPCNNHASNLEWTTHKENMRYSLTAGRFDRTDEWKAKLRTYNESHGRPIIGTNASTGEAVYFKCLNDCAAAGFHPSCVCNCCQGKRGKHKGFVWRYADEQGIQGV